MEVRSEHPHPLTRSGLRQGTSDRYQSLKRPILVNLYHD